jgi:hypothetical protein
MISEDQIALNICTSYIARVQERFTEETDVSRRYQHILKIRKWQLQRAVKNLSRLEDLETLRHGHFLAQQFYFDFADETSKDRAQINLIDILQAIAVEFHCELMQIEAEHPELRAQFAREKEKYRLWWNHFVQDAEELKMCRAEAS